MPAHSSHTHQHRTQKFLTQNDGEIVEIIRMCQGLCKISCVFCFETNRNNICLFPARISEALQNDCAKCSEKQKEAAEKVIKFMYKNKPDDWKQLQEKYDPDNTYYKKYENRLKDFVA